MTMPAKIAITTITTTAISFQDSTNITRVAAPPSSVTNMSGMFRGATNFNQNISGWNMSNVTLTSFMFYNAANFDQPIGSWDVSKVYDMQSMFFGAAKFNQPLASWNTGNVLQFAQMFYGAAKFNQPIVFAHCRASFRQGRLAAAIPEVAIVVIGPLYFTIFSPGVA